MFNKFLTTILLLVLAGSTHAVLTSNSLSSVQIGDVTFAYEAPTLANIGGEVAFKAHFASQGGATGQVFLTVMRQSGTMALPVVTRTAPTEPAGRNTVSADFTFSVDDPDSEQTFQLVFWTTLNRADGQQDKVDLGVAKLTVLPSDSLEPLRKLSTQNSFFIDSSNTPEGLQAVFDARAVEYSKTSAAQLADLGSNAIFFTRSASLANQGHPCHVVAITPDKHTLPTITRHAGQGNVIVMPAEMLRGLAHDGFAQLRLQQALVEMLRH